VTARQTYQLISGAINNARYRDALLFGPNARWFD
jgi:hypothetical protein